MAKTDVHSRKSQSIFDVLAPAPSTERFDTLFSRSGVVIERIASSGAQPIGRYCQDHDEWVILLRGRASMTIRGEPIELTAGSYVELPAHTPHEVLGTSEDALWLAVHVGAAEEGTNV